MDVDIGDGRDADLEACRFELLRCLSRRGAQLGMPSGDDFSLDAVDGSDLGYELGPGHVLVTDGVAVTRDSSFETTEHGFSNVEDAGHHRPARRVVDRAAVAPQRADQFLPLW